jgi:hypothetical protein
MPDTDPEPPPATLYAGWFRPSRRHRWERVVEDTDRGRCLDRLLSARTAGDYIVLAENENPNPDRLLP